MKTVQRVFIIGLVFLLVVLPLRAADAQTAGAQIRITQVDNSKFPHVTVYVSVTDAEGEPLPVDPGQIHISENGKPMQPTKVSGSGEIGSLTTLLVMDVSGSMNNAGKLKAAKAAARAFVEQMRPSDQAGLLTFNTKVTYVQPITTDQDALIESINSLKAENDTAMFDAVAQANDILQDYPGRKAIIVLTDGLDNQSKTTSKQITQSISSSGLSISTIGLGNPDNAGPFFGLNESELKSLAEQAGGVYSYATDPSELASLYELYGRAMQSEYRFTYLSPSPLRDGLGRTLNASLGGAASAKAKYNPGGVLPEVADPASWTVFLVLLTGLIVLLLFPAGLARIIALTSAKGNRATPTVPKPRIKLK